MSGKNLRKMLRLVHLLMALPIFLYFYSPLAGDATLALIVRLIIPVITLTGIAMWQQPRLLKLLNGNSQTSKPSAGTASAR